MRLRIEKAVTDCLGLSHDESGRAVLIRGALPGEVVECTILDGAKGVLKAEAAEVLEPSPLRRVPICPYYGRCGGCSFQIVSERDSASIKESIVRDNLIRIGKLSELPPFEEPAFGDERGYRHRARFHVSLRDRQWGFMARESNEVIHIESCCYALLQSQCLFPMPEGQLG